MKKFLEGVGEMNRELEYLVDLLREMEQNTRKVSGASNDGEVAVLQETLSELRGEFVEGMKTLKDGIANLKKKTSEGQTEYERHMREKQTHSLIDRTTRLVESFSTAQAEFGAEERRRVESQYIVAKPNITEEELEKIEYASPPDPFSFKKAPKHVTEKRKTSLKEISSGIQEVTQMTEQLNLLVHESDKKIDKITITATKTEVKAKKADKDLKSTLQYQKLARFAKLISFSILFFLVLIFIFAVIGGFVFIIIVLAQNFPSSNSTGGAGNGAPAAPTAPAAPPAS